MRNGNGPNGYQHDDIQARIDNIVNSGSPEQSMMMNGGFPGMNGMDMNQMAGMANPLMLQEMMMNQMALMAQMASTMGLPQQFGGPGYPMQGVMPGNMNMFPDGMNNGFPGPQQMGVNSGMNTGGRGRGGARGRGAGRGRGGMASSPPKMGESTSISSANDAPAPQPLPIAAPTPVATSAPAASVIPSAAPQRTGFVVPERPQSPTLCKFIVKCTNAHCRYSHPSPVATAESGVVLSNDPCEKGKDCKDKDCIKAHVSPAVLNPQGMPVPI